MESVCAGERPRLARGLSARAAARRLAGPVLACVLFALAAGNGVLISSGDNRATRYLASLLLVDGTLDLTRLPEYRQDPGHYSGVWVAGRLLPAFPLGTGILTLPLHAVALVLTDGEIDSSHMDLCEKLFAALFALAAAALLFHSLASRFGWRVAFAATSVFALATPQLSTGSQALYSTSGEVLCTTLALALILPPAESLSTSGAAFSGLAMAAAFLCRPTAVVSAGLLAVLVPSRRRWAYALAAGAGVLAVCAGEVALYHHPLGGYGLLNGGAGRWGHGVVAGFLGNLASPSRGLLVHFPYLLLVPAAWRRARSEPYIRRLFLVALLSSLATLALASSYFKWWGGHSLGPRLMAEASPFLALLLLPTLQSVFRRGTASPLGSGERSLTLALSASVAFAALTQVASIYNPEAARWNARVSVDTNPAALWSLPDSQLAATWRLPANVAARPADARAEAVPREDPLLTGSLDDPQPGVTVRGELLVRGWARTPGEDLEVAIEIDGHRRQPASFRRVSRPDVGAALPFLGDSSSCGYEARFPFDGAEGPHRVAAVFRSRDGHIRHYPETTFGWER